MIRKILPILFLSAFTIPSFALTEASEAAKQELKTAIKADDESRAKPGSSGMGRSGLTYIRSLDEAVNQGNKQQIENALTQIAENYRSPAVGQAVEKFQAAMNLAAKMDEEAELARMDSLLKEAGDAIRKASKTQDLDGILEKMGKVSEGGSERKSTKVSEAYQAVRRTKQFVASWQDYLQATAIGNRAKANQIVLNLISTNTDIPVPRSMVIAQINEPAPASTSAGSTPPEIKELDQIAPAVRQLRAIALNSRSNSDYPDLQGMELAIRTLTILDKAYQDFRVGLPVPLEPLLGPNDFQITAFTPSITELRAKLLLLLLAKEIGTIKSNAPKPGETVVQYLERMEKEAVSQGDDTAYVRLLEIRRISSSSESKSTAEVPGLADFRAGRAQQAAGQPGRAAISYQMALDSGPGLTLAGMIGKRLDEIKKAHPEEYKKSTERILQND